LGNSLFAKRKAINPPLLEVQLREKSFWQNTFKEKWLPVKFLREKGIG
jgi:hypothetical protein